MNVRGCAASSRPSAPRWPRQADRDEPRIGLLTPGPLNETYFEHANLARYLGFLLVEGDDLTVRDGAVYIRTVAGLKRLDVLLRRLDSEFADPLELDAASQLGVPGLIQAVRAGTVVLANMPGSGVLEARALLGFLPALAAACSARTLKMPNVATWWCGQKAEREQVLARLDDFAIAPAFGTRLPRPLAQRPRARRRAVAERARRLVERSPARHRLRRPGGGPAVDDAGVARRPADAAPVRAAGVRRRHAATAGRSCPAASAGSPTRPMPAPSR